MGRCTCLRSGARLCTLPSCPLSSGRNASRVVHQRRAIIGEIRPTGRGASGVRATFRCRMSNSLFLATRSLCDFIQNEINLSREFDPRSDAILSRRRDDDLTIDIVRARGL